MAQVVTVINFKSGVGKTTCAIELSTALARHFGKRTLLVDLDPQARATFYVMEQLHWKQWRDTKGSTYELFNRQDKHFPVRKAIVKDVLQGKSTVFDLLPSDPNLVDVDLRLADFVGHTILQRYFDKKLSGKEARFKRNTNYVISKRIVQKARTSGQAIAIEELRHIRQRTDSTARHSQRSHHCSWAFGQLRLFLTYKAALASVPLHTVDPGKTSRTCSECGHCAKANRKSQASFVCQACGHSDNADRNAAINISRAPVNGPLAVGRA